MNKILRYNYKNNFEWSGEVDVWESDFITHSKKTKIIYAHDAQSLFNSRETWNNKSWDIEKTINDLKLDVIVISAQTPGLEKRVNLLSPWTNSKLIKNAGYDFPVNTIGGAGSYYAKAIVETIIPDVLKKHNIPHETTKKYIIGSSMGGYINTYIASLYNDFFSGFGIFSPAYWFNEIILEKAIPYIKNYCGKIYIDIGTNEGKLAIKDYYLNFAKKAANIIKSNNPKADFNFIIDKDAIHDEDAWARRFKNMISWFLE